MVFVDYDDFFSGSRTGWHHGCLKDRRQVRVNPHKAELIQTKRTNTMLQKLNTKRGGFTLVEIMIVVAIIALLASIAVPNFLRARKRSQGTMVLEDLRMIDAAIDQYAIERGKGASAGALAWADVQTYLKTDSRLYLSGGNDIFGKPYGNFQIDSVPSFDTATQTDLSDVCPPDFFKPYVAQ
jgi:prepilin-type N-terminal cleavage/methylation domain-containing protein